jgi:CheY-like chemotaxis protein
MNDTGRVPRADAGTGGAILVVDDNELNRDLLSRRLRRDGHVVTVAEHGRAALDRMAKEPFDLVLLDIMMPELTGYEVLEIIKADAGLRDIPVVMITAATEEESIVRCLSLGAEDHLPKPFNPAILRARVGSSLAKKRLRDTEKL